MITTPHGWVQKARSGLWRALTSDGILTYHNTMQEALEALKCSLPLRS